MMKFQIMRPLSTKKIHGYSWLPLLGAALLFLPVKIIASPIPGMGSSELVSPKKGYMFNARGFHLNKGQTNWNLEGGENSPEASDETSKNSKNNEIAVRFQSPLSRGFLAVKTETLSEPVSLEIYAKKWIRDYSYYGFDVLGAKAFSQGNSRGYVIDLFHSKKLKQIRQVVFLKNKTAVVMTCTDDKKQFPLTLTNCNNILKTFSWIQPTESTVVFR